MDTTSASLSMLHSGSDVSCTILATDPTEGKAADLPEGFRRFFVGFRLARFAQILDRQIDVAIDLYQCFFALHHSRAGSLAKFFHHTGADLHLLGL